MDKMKLAIIETGLSKDPTKAEICIRLLRLITFSLSSITIIVDISVVKAEDPTPTNIPYFGLPDSLSNPEIWSPGNLFTGGILVLFVIFICLDRADFFRRR